MGKLRFWIHELILFSILLSSWHNAFALVEFETENGVYDTVRPMWPQLTFSISESAARLSALSGESFSEQTRTNQTGSDIQVQLYVTARNNGLLVFNGERITYTIEVKNSTSQAFNLSNATILNQLPRGIGNKVQIDQVRCADLCQIEYVTNTIMTPLGRMVDITEPVSVKWERSLNFSPGSVVTFSYSGRVVGQYDGAVIENQAYVIYSRNGENIFLFSPKVSTVVLVPVTRQGELDVSDVPTWHSSDLGGTISLDWGDFDHDGYLDLALGSTTGVKVYHNQNGRFMPLSGTPQTCTLGVRWADVISGGNLELIAVGSSIGNSAVMSGDNYIYSIKDGEIKTSGYFTSDYQLLRLEAGDVDRDNRIDLVASTNAINASCPVLLFKNNGNSFGGPGQCIVTNTATAAIALGDYDNDGRMDLALGNFPNRVVLLNNFVSVPTQTNQVDNTTTFLPYDLRWGDYDGDGDLDLAAAFPLDQLIRIYKNNSQAFSLTHEFRTAFFYTPLALDWADFDLDGRLDLVVAGNPPVVYLNVGEANGWFSSTHRFELPAETVKGQIWDLAAADQDNDGDLDLALGNRDSSSLLFTAFAPLLGDTLVPVGSEAFSGKSVAWGDFNDDGLVDLAYGAGGNNIDSRLYLNRGKNFVLEKTISAVPQASVAWGNVNRDSKGKLDLVIGSSTNVKIYFDRQFDSPWQIGNGNLTVRSLALGDLEGDGDLDLLVATNGPNMAYLNTGTGLGVYPIWVSAENEDSRSIAWADYDLDGYLDFAVGNYGKPVRVYRNLGSSSFALVWSTMESLATTSVAWGDVNRDGYPDLAVGNDGQKNLIYANDRGTFGRVLWVSNEMSRTTALAFGDWDNDGDLDLAVGNYGEPDQVYVNRGIRANMLQLDWIWQSRSRFRTTGVAWGDMDNDGDLDLAVSGECVNQTCGNQEMVNGIYINYLRSVPENNGNGSSPKMFNYPVYVSVNRPGITKLAYFYSTPEILSGPYTPNITISYQLRDFGPYTSIYTTVYEYSPDGGGTWKRATPASPPTARLTLSNTPQSLNFVWNAIADRVFSDNVLFRITVIFDDPVGPVQYATSSATSPPFRVSSNSCVWPVHPTIKVIPANPQPNEQVTFEGAVGLGSGRLDFYWDLGDGTIKRGQVVKHTYKIGGRYNITLGVYSEPCPVVRVVSSTQQLVVGLGGSNIYLPLVIKSPGRGSGAGVSTDLELAGSTGRLPDVHHVYGTAWSDNVGVLLGSNGSLDLQSVQTATVTDTQIYTDCYPNNTGQPCTSYSFDKNLHISSQPAVNYDGKSVTFWSTANLVSNNGDQNIEVFVARPLTVSQFTYTQVTSSTGSVLGGFSLWPSLNADGTRLVMFSDQDLDNGKNPDQNFEIFAYDFNLRKFIQLTQTEECVNLYPSISADGHRVAYVSSCGESGESFSQKVVIAEVDRFGRVTETWSIRAKEGYYAQPAISGDGRYVVFVHSQPYAHIIQRVDIETKDVITIGHGLQPDINHSGSRIVYVQDRNIWMADVVSSVITFTQITTDSSQNNEQPSIDGSGNRIVYINDEGVGIYDLVTRVRTKIGAQKDVNSRPMIGGGGAHVVYAANQTIHYLEFPLVDLEVTKASTLTPLVPGTAVTYTVIVTNHGPSNVSRARITDIWPPSITQFNWKCEPGGVVISNGSSITDGLEFTLSAGAQFTCTLWGKLDSNIQSGVTNCVKVSAPSGVVEHITTNNQACDVQIPRARSDLSITQSVPFHLILAGETLTYTLYYENKGPSDAAGVYITNNLPVSTTFKGMSYPITLTPTTGTNGLVWWNIGTLTANKSITLSFTVWVDPEVVTGTVLANRVTIASQADDPITGDNHSVLSVTVGNRADLAITKLAKPEPVVAGDPLTYTLIFTNFGPSTALNVCVTDTLPVSVTFKNQLTSTLGQWNIAMPGQVYWCGDLGKNVTGTIEFVVTVSNNITWPGVFTNRVSITHWSDPHPHNNVSETRTNVHIPIDLQVNKVGSPNQVSPGQAVTWTVWVTNTSSSVAVANTTISESLPSGVLANASWTCQSSVNSSCGQVSGTVPFSQTIGWLGANGHVTYTIVGTVVPSVTGSLLTNTVFVTVPMGYVDTIPRNNQDSAGISLVPQADFKVHKRAWPEPAVAGTILTYTIVLTNVGPSYARPVTLTDQLSTGVRYGGVVSGDRPIITGSPSVWQWNELCDNCTKTVQFTVTVNSDVLTGTQLTNTVIITGGAQDPVNDNVFTISTPVRTQADLAITKLMSTDDNVLTCTLIYTNNGPSYAREVYITDTLPVSVTWGGVASGGVGWTGPVTTSFGGITQVHWHSPSLAVTTGTIVYTVTVNPAVPPGAVMTNSAVITSNTPDMVSGNNTAAITITLSVTVDLSISKSAKPDVVLAGELLTYTLTFTNNNSSFGCHNVYVTDTLPVNVTLQGFTPSVFGSPVVSYGNVLTWHTPFLSPAASGLITVVVLVDSDIMTGTVISNTASITGSKEVGENNNTSKVTTTVHTKADLAITKTGSFNVVAGTVLTYTLTFTNAGPSYAREVYITDTLPVSVTWGGVASGGVGWTGPVTTSFGGITQVHWYSPSLAVTTGTMVYTVTVDPAVPHGGVITNRVTITTATHDPSSPNNSYSLATTVSGEADLAITKHVAEVYTDSITYTLIYTNHGPSLAMSITITDTWEGATSGSVITDVQSCIQKDVEFTYVCSIASLPPGHSGMFTVTLRDGGEAITVPITNAVSISGTVYDPITSNNEALITTTLVADLSINKSVERATGDGGVLTYTLTFTNAGPLYAHKVYITDTLPVSVTWGGVVSSSVDWSSGPVIASSEGITRVHWYTPSLAVTEGTIMYTVTVDPAVPDGSVITNSAVITSATPDEVSVNNGTTRTITLPVTVDLSISKSAESEIVLAGELLTYALAYTNTNLSFGCYEVYITDTLPVSVTAQEWITPTDADWTVITGGNDLVWYTPFLPPAASGLITVVVLVDSDIMTGTVMSNTALITGSKEVGGNNNTSTVSTTVHTEADLAITKTGSSGVVAGTVLTYTLTFTNAGPSYAREVYITDTLPVSVTWGGVVSSSVDWSSGPDITSSEGITRVHWYTPSLAVTEGTIMYTVTVNPDVPDGAEISNTVEITSDVWDPTDNNRAIALAHPNSFIVRDVLVYTLPGDDPELWIRDDRIGGKNASFVQVPDGGGLACDEIWKLLNMTDSPRLSMAWPKEGLRYARWLSGMLILCLLRILAGFYGRNHFM